MSRQNVRPKTHDVDGLMTVLADVFRRSADGEDVEIRVSGGLLHFAPCDCCGQLSQGPYIDLSGPLDEWLPEGWAEEASDA